MNIEIYTVVNTAHNLMTHGKGILAADESFSTIAKRFKKVNLDSTPELRRVYREMLFTAPDLERYISGVIMFDETIRQRSSQGVPFATLLRERGIIPGIKVDLGTKPLPFFPQEKFTAGLDGLEERLTEYRELGARFTKWRAVFKIGDTTPSIECIKANIAALVRYAALSQQAQLVPIVEPEILMEGSHDMESCEYHTRRICSLLFNELVNNRVVLEGLILKPNMILPGKNSEQSAGADEIGAATVRVLNRTVAPAVCGIAFLSGGQSSVSATENLNAINSMGKSSPWSLTFSFSRALQEQPLSVWRGREEKIKEAQSAFIYRARCASAASSGNYSSALEEHK